MLKRKLILLVALATAFSLIFTPMAAFSQVEDGEEMSVGVETILENDIKQVISDEVSLDPVRSLVTSDRSDFEMITIPEEEINPSSLPVIDGAEMRSDLGQFEVVARSARNARMPAKLDVSSDDLESADSASSLSSNSRNMFLPVNAWVTGTFTAAGQQVLFETQAPGNGKLTFHLNVPSLSNYDYDLYVYNSSFALVAWSENAPGIDEHIAFSAVANQTYYILVNAWSHSGNPAQFTLYNYYTTTMDSYEINDHPILPASGGPGSRGPVNLSVNAPTYHATLDNPCDEDWYRFTVSNNRLLIRMATPANSNVVGVLYNQNFGVVGTVSNSGYTQYSVSSGTYFLRILNPSHDRAEQYQLTLNNFNFSGTIAHVLAHNNSNQRVAYMTNQDILYVNAQNYNVGLANLGFTYENSSLGKITVQSSGTTWAIFGSYSSNLPTINGIGGNASDALLFVNSGGVAVANTKYQIGAPSQFLNTTVPANAGGFVINLSNTPSTGRHPRIDFYAPGFYNGIRMNNYAHGFYNTFIERYGSTFRYEDGTIMG